jgi:hypothetical protein
MQFQSTECQKDHWASHKTECRPSNVTGITIYCDGERTHGIFETVQLDAKHDIHHLGELCPVSKAVGLPLIIYRHIRTDSLRMRRDPYLDNQIATFLMVELYDGFAPPRYASCYPYREVLVLILSMIKMATMCRDGK